MMGNANEEGKPAFVLCPERLPPEISGHRIVCNDKCVYSYGGYSPTRESDPMIKELWMYHCLRKVWTKVPLAGDVPCEVASSGVVLVDDCMILIGGTGIPFGQLLNRFVYYCDLRKRNDNGAVVWRKLPQSGPVPQPRYGQAVAVHNHQLYVVGGTDGNTYSIEVHRLDLRTFVWEKLAEDSTDPLDEVPEIRYRAEIVVRDSEIIVFGGGTPHLVYDLQNLPVFNLETRKWSRRPTIQDPERGYPSARRCHSVVKSICGTWAIVAGGIGEEGCFDDIWKLHLPEMKWTRIRRSLPEEVFFHSSAISRSHRMFTFGGVVDIDIRTNKLSFLDVTVPPLQDLSLQKLLDTAPSLLEADLNSLKNIGIPRKHALRIIR